MKKILKSISPLSIFLFVSPIYAQEPPKLTDGSIRSMVDNALDYLFPIAGLICLVFVIQGGYMWIISAGDPARVKQAQGTLTWAILGFIFVMVILGLLRALIKFVS